MEIQYTRSPSAPKEPFSRANFSDAGADIRSSEDVVVPPLGRAVVPTGVRMKIPEGYYGRIAPRSGLAHKYGIDVLAGVVDSSYRGEIKVILHNTDKNEEFRVFAGDRIAQLIVEKHYNFDFFEVEELDSTERGAAGFGSSGT